MRSCCLSLAFLAAWSTTSEIVDTGPTSSDVVQEGSTGTQVYWGGQIVKTKNLDNRTLVEVLAFPLNAEGQPPVDQAPQGPYIVEKAGFLEPREYARNRLLEVRGVHQGFTDGKVDDAAYDYPVVVGQSLKLWDGEPAPISGQPRVRPSIGVGIDTGSGGTHVGGGIGVGIGF